MNEFGNKSNLIKIDGERLKNAILSKGITVADAGRKIGYSKKALQNAVCLNGISKPMMLLVKSELGIEFDEYKRIEPQKPSDEPQDERNADIRGMVRHEVKEALEEYLNEHLEDRRVELWRFLWRYLGKKSRMWHTSRVRSVETRSCMY